MKFSTLDGFLVIGLDDGSHATVASFKGVEKLDTIDAVVEMVSRRIRSSAEALESYARAGDATGLCW
jgi:hypothetical protein